MDGVRRAGLRRVPFLREIAEGSRAKSRKGNQQRAITANDKRGHRNPNDSERGPPSAFALFSLACAGRGRNCAARHLFSSGFGRLDHVSVEVSAVYKFAAA